MALQNDARSSQDQTSPSVARRALSRRLVRRRSGPRVTHAEVTVHGHRVQYQVVGSGEPVLLVHGLAGSQRWWQRNVAALAASHTVYLLNLPGFGAFRWRGLPFVLAEAADWLEAWIEAAGIGPCHIVAHSMGGHVTLRLAARRPDLARRLILVAPALVARHRRLLAYAPALIAAGYAASPSFLPILALDSLRCGPLTLLRATRSLLAHDIRDELASVAAPTLLVWGDRDALVPPALAPAIQVALPDARLLMLPGAGHVAQYDRPAAFNAAALAFLSSHPNHANEAAESPGRSDWGSSLLTPDS